MNPACPTKIVTFSNDMTLRILSSSGIQDSALIVPPNFNIRSVAFSSSESKHKKILMPSYIFKVILFRAAVHDYIQIWRSFGQRLKNQSDEAQVIFLF